MKFWSLVCLALACCLGCKSAQILPAISDAKPETDTDAACFSVIETAVEPQPPGAIGPVAVAYVEKTADAPGYHPIVFFRCLDEQGLTVAVVSAADHRFGHDGKGVKRRLERAVPDGTAEIQVTVRSEAGVYGGEPKLSPAGGRSTLHEAEER